MAGEGQEPGGGVGFKSTCWREGGAAAAAPWGWCPPPGMACVGDLVRATCRPGRVRISRYLGRVQWRSSIRQTFPEHLLGVRQGLVG